MMAIKPTDLSRDVMHLLKDHGPVVLTYFAIVATFWGCQFNRLRYLVARLVTLLAVVRRHRFRKWIRCPWRHSTFCKPCWMRRGNPCDQRKGRELARNRLLRAFSKRLERGREIPSVCGSQR